MIIPNFNFSCNGRIAGITASMSFGIRISFNRRHLPLFQIWRPSSNSSIYTIINQTQFAFPSFVSTGPGLFSGYYFSDLVLTNDDRIEFYSEDVIGYYQQTVPLRRVYSIQRSTHISYTIGSNNPTTTFDISRAAENPVQPLITVFIGEKCEFYYYNMFVHN